MLNLRDYASSIQLRYDFRKLRKNISKIKRYHIEVYVLFFVAILFLSSIFLKCTKNTPQFRFDEI